MAPAKCTRIIWDSYNSSPPQVIDASAVSRRVLASGYLQHRIIVTVGASARGDPSAAGLRCQWRPQASYRAVASRHGVEPEPQWRGFDPGLHAARRADQFVFSHVANVPQDCRWLPSKKNFQSRARFGQNRHIYPWRPRSAGCAGPRGCSGTCIAERRAWTRPA